MVWYARDQGQQSNSGSLISEKPTGGWRQAYRTFEYDVHEIWQSQRRAEQMNSDEREATYRIDNLTSPSATAKRRRSVLVSGALKGDFGPTTVRLEDQRSGHAAT